MILTGRGMAEPENILGGAQGRLSGRRAQARAQRALSLFLYFGIERVTLKNKRRISNFVKWEIRLLFSRVTVCPLPCMSQFPKASSAGP